MSYLYGHGGFGTRVVVPDPAAIVVEPWAACTARKLGFGYAAWEYSLIRSLRIFRSGPTGIGRLGVRPAPDGLRARSRARVVPPALPRSRR